MLNSRIIRLLFSLLLVTATMLHADRATATVSTTTARWNYTGNGSTTGFPYTNKVYAATDLAVYVDGVLKALTSDYSVSGVGSASGGSVTFVTAPAAAAKVVILSNIPLTQSAALTGVGAFSPTSVEQNGLDRIVRELQGVSARVDRAPLLPLTTTQTGPVLAAPGASQWLRWDASGTTIEAADLPTLTGAAVSALASYTRAGLPSGAAAGTLVRVTDDIRGVWLYNGSVWVPVAGEIIRAADFGAKCDDSTDDSVAVQAALTQAASGDARGIVEIPEGICKITVPLTISGLNVHTKGVTIRGYGMNVSRLRSYITSNTGVLLTIGSGGGVQNGVTIENVGFDSASSATNHAGGLVDCQFCRDARFNNVRIGGGDSTTNPGFGLKLSRAQNVRVTGGQVLMGSSATGWVGIWVTSLSGSAGQGMMISGTTIKGVRPTNRVIHASDCTIALGSDVLNCATSQPFTADDATYQRIIFVAGASGSGSALQTYIKTYNSASQVVLGTTAGTAVAANGKVSFRVSAGILLDDQAGHEHVMGPDNTIESNHVGVLFAKGNSHLFASNFESGSLGDGQATLGWTVTDAAITSGAATLTSATAAFDSSHIGCPVMINRAGPNGEPLVTHIAGVTNATTATVAVNATLTVSGQTAKFCGDVLVQIGLWGGDRAGNARVTSNTSSAGANAHHFVILAQNNGTTYLQSNSLVSPSGFNVLLSANNDNRATFMSHNTWSCLANVAYSGTQGKLFCRDAGTSNTPSGEIQVDDDTNDGDPTAGTQIPNAASLSTITLDNDGGTTTVATIRNVHGGQVLTIRCADNFSVLTHGTGNLETRSGQNITCVNGERHVFVASVSNSASTAPILHHVGSYPDFNGKVLRRRQSVTVADNGGGTAAAFTLTITGAYVEITCNDANGCDATVSETGALEGEDVRIVNISANAVNFADTAGVTELAGAFAMGQYDALSLIYEGTRWVETSRSNN